MPAPTANEAASQITKFSGVLASGMCLGIPIDVNCLLFILPGSRGSQVTVQLTPRVPGVNPDQTGVVFQLTVQQNAPVLVDGRRYQCVTLPSGQVPPTITSGNLQVLYPAVAGVNWLFLSKDTPWQPIQGKDRRAIKITDLTLQSAATIAPPAGKKWILLAATVKLTTSSSAGSRQVWANLIRSGSRIEQLATSGAQTGVSSVFTGGGGVSSLSQLANYTLWTGGFLEVTENDTVELQINLIAGDTIAMLVIAIEEDL